VRTFPSVLIAELKQIINCLRCGSQTTLFFSKKAEAERRSILSFRQNTLSTLSLSLSIAPPPSLPPPPIASTSAHTRNNRDKIYFATLLKVLHLCVSFFFLLPLLLQSSLTNTSAVASPFGEGGGRTTTEGCWATEESCFLPLCSTSSRWIKTDENISRNSNKTTHRNILQHFFFIATSIVWWRLSWFQTLGKKNKSQEAHFYPLS